MIDLKGIVAPFTTAFKEDGAIDFSLIKGQVDWLIDKGVHGLAAGGSTGEGHVLDRQEYSDLIAATVEATAGRVPVVAAMRSLYS